MNQVHYKRHLKPFSSQLFNHFSDNTKHTTFRPVYEVSAFGYTEANLHHIINDSLDK